MLFILRLAWVVKVGMIMVKTHMFIFLNLMKICITVAGNCNQFDKAESAFEKAKEDGFANAISFKFSSSFC